MRPDRAYEFEETKKTGPASIGLGNPSDEPQRLSGDKSNVDQSARRDRRDHRHAFCRLCDLTPNHAVERQDQIALGDVDQVTSVNDLFGQFDEVCAYGST